LIDLQQYSYSKYVDNYCSSRNHPFIRATQK